MCVFELDSTYANNFQTSINIRNNTGIGSVTPKKNNESYKTFLFVSL